jgi:hypothetical protein
MPSPRLGHKESLAPFSAMGYLVYCQDSHVEALTQVHFNVTVFEDKVFISLSKSK